MSYVLGQSVKLSGAFTDDDGAAANPTTVTCRVKAPDGTVTIYTSATTPAVVNTATGTYDLVISVDQPGYWTYRWEGDTGAVTPRDEDQFHVMSSAFA